MTDIQEIQENMITLIDEAGEEQNFEILFTFQDNDQNYVLYFDPKEADGELFAAKYDPENDNGGKLIAIENPKEWKIVESALSNFQKEDAVIEEDE